MKRMFSLNVTWQLFLDTLAVISRKKSEVVSDIFSPALEMQFVQFIEISGNICANTNLY